MTMTSMTGFARATGQYEDLTWVWEVRSVNSKGLEFRARLPGGFENLDGDLRRRVQAVVTRGSVTASFQYQRTTAAGAVAVNRAALDALMDLVRDTGNDGSLAPTSLGQLLVVPGVVEPVAAHPDEEEEAARRVAILTSFDEALGQMVAMRAVEGAALVPVLTGFLDQIEALVGQAEASPATRPEALKDRFRTRIEEFVADTPGISAERLAQEVALLASKADVREELDRLHSHVVAARALMDGGAPAGRKLDFLAQEFNREANTLCSKSSDVDLTRIGLDLKAVIGQFR
ncbi:MAG: YicC/YloC family endoribonuclease [Sphingomonadales bacterium]